jgi:PKD repeat protein
MKLLHIGVMILLLAGAVSCKKKEYPDSATTNDAVFFFNGSVSDNPVSVAAGINDYYMYSSYKQDSNGVYSFTGNLRKTDCTDNCPLSLSISLRDSKQLPMGSLTTADTFTPGDYTFADNNPEYKVTFLRSYNGNPASYHWDYGDGSTGDSTTHIYKKSGAYKVSLTIKDVNGYVSSISNTVKVGLPANACRAEITALNLPNGNVVTFAQSSSGQGTLSYLWNFGDGTFSTAANPGAHTYAIAGAYPVSLRVTDANSEVTYAYYNVITQSDLASRAPNFRVGSISSIQPLNLSTASFSWTDPSGITYRSDRVTQPSSSYFKVVSVGDYSPNEKGEKTKKVKVNLSCRLSDGINTITLNNAVAVICVAYR